MGWVYSYKGVCMVKVMVMDMGMKSAGTLYSRFLLPSSFPLQLADV